MARRAAKSDEDIRLPARNRDCQGADLLPAFSTEPPLLRIEIRSPEDRAIRLEDKIDEYLGFGVPDIWVIDPRKKHAWSYSQEDKREATTLLTTLDPRIEVPITDLFSELEEDVEAE